jgi:hypothetical protein
MSWKQIIPYLPTLLLVLVALPNVVKAFLELQKAKIDKEKSLIEYNNLVKKSNQDIASLAHTSDETDPKFDLPPPELEVVPTRIAIFFTAIFAFSLVSFGYFSVSFPVTTSSVAGMLSCTLTAILSIIFLGSRLLFAHVANEAEKQRWISMKMGLENIGMTVESLKLLFRLVEGNSDSQKDAISHIETLVRDLTNQSR